MLGGSLGDRFGRRKSLHDRACVVRGHVFAVRASRRPSSVLSRARGAGCGGRAAVPVSLAIISASFPTRTAGAAIGAWSGLGGIAGAIGPFLGGWLISAVSWRAVFLINLPLVRRRVVVLACGTCPRPATPTPTPHLDLAGARRSRSGSAGWSTRSSRARRRVGGRRGRRGRRRRAVARVLHRRSSAVARIRWCRSTLFASRQFSGANATTLFVYAALGATTFFVVVLPADEPRLLAAGRRARRCSRSRSSCCCSRARRARSRSASDPRWPMTDRPARRRRRAWPVRAGRARACPTWPASCRPPSCSASA